MGSICKKLSCSQTGDNLEYIIDASSFHINTDVTINSIISNIQISKQANNFITIKNDKKIKTIILNNAVVKIQNIYRKYCIWKQKFNYAKSDKINNNMKSQDNSVTFKYIGELKLDKKEGFGIQLWENGASYIGKFKNDKACGFGFFQNDDGDKYVGMIKVYYNIYR